MRIWGFFAGLLLFCRLSWAVEVFPIAEVKKGMRGIARTVFEGTKIEDFEIEVVDVFQDFYPKKPVVVIRFIDEKSRFTGVVSGMSGSPVYLQGKLLGAIAYRFGGFQKEPIAGVTPFEQMQEVAPMEGHREMERPTPAFHPVYFLAARGLDQEKAWEEFRSRFSVRFSPQLPQDWSLTPLVISHSFRQPMVRKIIEELYAPLGVLADAGGGGGEQEYPLEPGSPISGVLMEGDTDFFATGTLTHREGKEFFAFGHPFFFSGATRMPVASATIMTTVSSLLASFKMANVGKISGILLQDRLPAIYGRLEEPAPMVPVSFHLHYPWGKSYSFHNRAADDETYKDIQALLISFAYFDSVLGGQQAFNDFQTLQMTTRIQFKKYGTLKLQNLYTGGFQRFGNFAFPTSSLADSLFDLFFTLLSVNLNGFEFVEMKDVYVETKAIPGIRRKEIVSALAESTKVRPGESVRIRVRLKEFGTNKEEIIDIPIRIPSSLQEGFATVFIGSGSTAEWEEFRLEPAFPKSFPELLQMLQRRKRNDVLYAFLEIPTSGYRTDTALLPSLPYSILQILRENPGRRPARLSAWIVERKEMDLNAYVDGTAWIRLTILPAKGE